MAKEQEVLSSVHNAIRILQNFSLTETELGISELSVRLGLAKSTVFRLMKTLQENNLVEKNEETQKYHLGIGAFELGFRVYHSMELRRIAVPILDRLAKSIRRVARLSVYDQGGAVYLCKRIPDEDNGTISKIGDRVPCYCTAVGKVLLSYQDDSEIDRVLDRELTPYTSKTIVSPTVLKQQLIEVRKSGYALTNEELRVGVCSVAVPVQNDMGKVIAAVSVTGPKALFYPNQINQYVQELKVASRLITERIGM